MMVCAVIVAGGRSSRMGGEKALELIGGRSILEWIVSRIAPQVDAIVLNANGDRQRFASSGLDVIPDVVSGVGTPLAGLHAALAHATAGGFDAALTVPSDSPFIPEDLAERLGTPGTAAVAASAGQVHYLTGLWPVTLLPKAVTVLGENPLPRMQDWVRIAEAAVVEWPAEPFDPFFNVNTRDELAEAGRIAERFSP